MKFFTLVFLSILFSCNKAATSNPDEAQIKLLNEWIYALKLNDFHFNNEVITRPPGVNQLLFGLTLPSEGGVSLKTHCVYYQVPYKKIAGVLRIEEIKSDLKCPESSGNSTYAELQDVKDFFIKLENFSLIFNFKIKNEKKEWHFPLVNISDGLLHEKYQPMKQRKWRSGLMLMRINDESFKNSNNKYLGKISDSYSKGAAIRCQQVDKNCQSVGEDRCGECRYGWYQVVDYQCPQGGSKFCGQNHCGEKNEPACPRGSKIVNAEDAGICQNDLTPVMNADHILVCQ